MSYFCNDGFEIDFVVHIKLFCVCANTGHPYRVFIVCRFHRLPKWRHSGAGLLCFL